MDIIINTIKETTCILHDPAGKRVGKITSYLELADVRVQIRDKKLSGYYIVWENKQEAATDHILLIDEYGKLDEWPKGFFDEYDILLDKLLDWEVCR